MKGPEKGKITNRKFNQWLIEGNYEVLGREFPTRIQSGGWPDFITRNKTGEIEFFEIKSGKHRLDPHQREILKILRKLGKVHVMRLSDDMKTFTEETPKELQ